MKGFVISRRFVPTTNSLAISLFKLLSNSKNQYIVYSQLSENTWNYAERSDMLSDNIESAIGPTNEAEWIKEAAEDCIKQIEEGGIDFVMTCVYPPYDHRVGLEIKKRVPNIFWVTYWGDPVANVPNILAEVGKPYNNPDEMKKIAYEREIFEKSDLLVFTNDYQKRFMLNEFLDMYNAKSFSIPHSFTDGLYRELPSDNQDKIVVAHVGHLYEIRHIYHLINAVYASKYKGRFRFKIIGHISPEQVKYIHRLKLDEQFDLMGEKNYFDSLDEMKKSDILMSVDATVDMIDHSIFMPSKISDYLGAKKPILFISYDKGVAADIAKETGNPLVLNNEVELSKLLNNVVEKGIWAPNYANYDNYNAKNVSAYFDHELLRRKKEWAASQG